MDKERKAKINRPGKAHMDIGDIDMEAIMESDLEDYEIAAVLGMSPGQVSKIRRELF